MWRKHRESSSDTGTAGTRSKRHVQLVGRVYSDLCGQNYRKGSNAPDARAESNGMIYYSRSSLRVLSLLDSRRSPHADGYSCAMACRSRDWKVYTRFDIVALHASFVAQTTTVERGNILHKMQPTRLQSWVSVHTTPKSPSHSVFGFSHERTQRPHPSSLARAANSGPAVQLRSWMTKTGCAAVCIFIYI